MKQGNLYSDKADPARKPNLYASDKPVEPKTNKLLSSYWAEVKRYGTASSKWVDEGEQIERLYLEEDRTAASERRFALLWANIETLKPAVYAKPPTVMCSRRYRDNDPIARTAAELMERATNTMFELYDVDETFQMVRDDRLLPGRGQAWVRYEPTFERYPDDEADEPAEGEEPPMRERVASERVCTDYVHWTDFGHNVAGTWNDVYLVWRNVYKTREEAEERFGEKVANQLSYNSKLPGSAVDRTNAPDTSSTDNFCKIIEIWDKRKRLVSWMTESYPDFLDSGKPPTNFSNFFPCPRPCYATKTAKSLIPRPDYVYYRDQAKEINDLTAKIAVMSEWLIVKAFIPSAPSGVADSIEEMIREKSNRELFISVESQQEWAERGGAAKLIDWLPIDMIIKAIQAAIAARTQLIQDVFQITGLSDILRGQTDPGETLGAQELKAQTGSRRLRNTKDEVARFCRDVARLNAEIIAEQFSPETIAEITGYRYEPQPAQQMPLLPGAQPPMQLAGPQSPLLGNVLPMPGVTPLQRQPMPPQQPQMGMPAQEEDEGPAMVFDDRVVKLLRDDRLRSFRIDTETDSTAQADEQAEKQSRIEFMNATGQFMDKAVSAIQNVPEMARLSGDMLMYAVRGFRAGRQVEEQIEKTFSALAKKAQQAIGQPAPPTPEQMKAESDKAANEQKMAQSAQEHQQQMMVEQQKAQADLMLKDKQIELEAMKTQQAADEHLMRMAEMEKKAELNAQQERFRQQAIADKEAEQQQERELARVERAMNVMETDRRAQREESLHARQREGAVTQDIDRERVERVRGETDASSREFMAKIAKGLSDNQALIAAVTAPRKVEIIRGSDGKATGATSVPSGGAA